MDHDRVRLAALAFGIGAAFILWTAASFHIGRQAGKRSPQPAVNVKADTLVAQQVVTIRDTLRVLGPFYVTARIERPQLFPVTDTVRIHDTLFVALPREVREYPGEDYRAQVSGVDPSLDWIEVYPKTKIVTQSVQVPGPQRWKRIGWGVAAGPGVFWQPGMDNVTPGVGILVGLRINL